MRLRSAPIGILMVISLTRLQPSNHREQRPGHLDLRFVNPLALGDTILGNGRRPVAEVQAIGSWPVIGVPEVADVQGDGDGHDVAGFEVGGTGGVCVD